MIWFFRNLVYSYKDFKDGSEAKEYFKNLNDDINKLFKEGKLEKKKTLPVIYTAKKLGYKTFIHEQNSIPGVSNKFLSRYADKIGISLEASKKYFPNKKVIYTGNPLSEEVYNSKFVAKDDLGLNLTMGKKLVLIVMGSLGSTTMNKNLKEALPLFNDKDYEVVFVTGKGYYDEYKNVKHSNNVKIVSYLDNMASVLKNTDLIVSRAGASSIAEITD